MDERKVTVWKLADNGGYLVLGPFVHIPDDARIVSSGFPVYGGSALDEVVRLRELADRLEQATIRLSYAEETRFREIQKVSDHAKRRIVLEDFVDHQFNNDLTIQIIYWMNPSDWNKDPLKILVVSDTFPTGKVTPFHFAARPPAVPIDFEIAEVTPEEHERIKSGEIPLPKGWWSLASAPSYKRPETPVAPPDDTTTGTT